MSYGFRFIIVFAILLLVLAIRFIQFYKDKPIYRPDQEIILTTTLLTEPQATGRIQRFYVDNILIIAPRFPEYHYGENLAISGTLESKVLNDKKPASRQGGQILMLSFPKIESRPPVGGLALTRDIRQKIIGIFKETLPSSEGGLLLGIVFGIKESLPKDLFDNLRITGTLHVVAASGMNVTLVAGFISVFFGTFLSRQIAFSLSIVGILFYALLAGLEPSITRATIMGFLSFLALILGRQNWAILSLFFVGWLMLAINPRTLLDIGFQLSFLATLGLIAIKPILNSQLLLKDIRRYQLGNDLTTTLSAQIATLPILLANFGSYSLLSILTNTLVLWTIPLLMIIGGLAAMVALAVPFLAKILLVAALPFLFFFERVISFFAMFGGQIAMENFPVTITLGYYLILLSIILVLLKKQRV